MKFFKKLLIYFAFIFGVIVILALGAFAYMYFSPNTSLLGLEYILYKEDVQEKYTTSTDLSVSGVKAVEIVTELSDIYIMPNTQSGEIIVRQNQNFSGLVKSINSDLSVDVSVKTKSFEEKETYFKTFSVVVDEPSGWVSKGNSFVVVYIPNNLAVDTIYAKSENGNIYYYSYNNDGAILDCTDLYLKTSNGGFVDIWNKESIANYYLTTGSGKVNFNETKTIDAASIKFTTKNGSLKMRNASKDATIKLTDALYVRSTDVKYGPSISIDKLLGNLNVDAKNGKYSISQIGSSGAANEKVAAMTLKKSEINFETVYAQLSLLSDNTESENYITIDKLITQDKTNILETGKGNVTINNLNGHIAIDASSGNINIKKANINKDVYTYTSSGSIRVNYEYVEDYENGDNNLKVITKTGNINLTNVSCLLEIKVLTPSSNSGLNITFSNISAGSSYSNIIDANNRNIKIKLVGLSDQLQFRIASTGVVEIMQGTVGTDVSTPKDAYNVINNDYLLDLPGYENFTHGYRIGYTKDENTYQTNAFNMWGILCIKTTGLTYVQAQTEVD